ncbi:hypothetical protein [Limnobacter sp.]|uniref:hypothetical protein n=1 Tax=Limnobacter sp. TaxID=2003368 RepID=UPI002736B05E|nr:hypothetical protein [Limnobacter sp.]MDP3273416.1 hypothetical protein [Limnobacter sp.]
MSSTAITYMDIDLTVEYDFESGEPETRWEPGCADEAIINSVCVGDVDITNIIGSDHLERIAERVAADHDDDSAAEHADYLIDQMEAY